MPKLLTDSTTISNPKESKPKNGKKPPNQNGKTGSHTAKESSKDGDKKPSKGGSVMKVRPGKEDRDILYPSLDILLYSATPTEHYPEVQPLSGEDAREILGWSENPEGNLDFKENYLLKDRYDKKIRCTSNQRNRPFSLQLADDYALEILRLKWRLNGETIILDKYGEVQSGQHRLIGLILAIQEWHRDQTRPKGEQLWQKNWPEEPTMETIAVAGIGATDDILNTLDTGRPRTFVDALYRSEWFKGEPMNVKHDLSKIMGNALKLVWDRTQRADFTEAHRRPISESFVFLDSHPRLMECVKFIHSEGEGKKITTFLSLGQASGLLYLMGAAASEAESYSTEKDLDWKLWEKAQEFWVDVAANGKATENLREALMAIPVELSSGLSSKLRFGMIIKGWNLFSNKKKIVFDPADKEASNVWIEYSVDAEDRIWPSESPRIGGIDVEYAKEDEVPPESETKEKVAGECPHGGDHEWVDDTEKPGNQVCSRCLEPKAVTRKKGA